MYSSDIYSIVYIKFVYSLAVSIRFDLTILCPCDRILVVGRHFGYVEIISNDIKCNVLETCDVIVIGVVVAIGPMQSF